MRRGKWTILGYHVSEIRCDWDSTYLGGKNQRTFLGYYNKVLSQAMVSLFSGTLSNVFYWRCLPSEASLPSIVLVVIWKITFSLAKPGERISSFSVGSHRALLCSCSAYVRLVVDVQHLVFLQCRLSAALRTGEWIFIVYWRCPSKEEMLC